MLSMDSHGEFGGTHIGINMIARFWPYSMAAHSYICHRSIIYFFDILPPDCPCTETSTFMRTFTFDEPGNCGD